ncbi:MAG: DUF1028 domain-containing protein [Chloroflexota bacterium]|nr:MAG: hypothetical protein KatS3mg045_0876 [Bellilinea sp.]
MMESARFARLAPFAHTYSIIARDPQSGEMGVAVQSHWFSVGSIVAWGEAGVGVVATQALVRVAYGPQGLALMRSGVPAPAALQALLAADEEREVRQVAMLDSQGRGAVHTGSRCVADAGHVMGDGFSAQANMMVSPMVWGAMAEAYRRTQGDLAERLMAALEAGQAEGGDLRGQQSACLLVVAGERTDQPWEGVRVNLRVDDHPKPLEELRRLLTVHRAYDWMNRGDALLGIGDTEAAMQAYRRAAALLPENEEILFWQAVTLADLGRLEEAVPIFQDVFRRNPLWKVMVKRLPPAGLMRSDSQVIERILGVV